MTSISTPKTGPLTKEYEDGHARVFGEKPSRYCQACGRLPSFCECSLDKLSAIPDLHDLAERIRAAQ